MPPVEKVSKGGIVLHTEAHAERYQLAAVKGEVVAMGELAYEREEVPRCKIGDKVLTAKYVGVDHHDDDTEEWYRLVNDEDIIGIVEE